MNMQVNAKRIKHLREQNCWSQLQLSEMAGISLRTLQRLEAKSVASHETVKGLAAVFEVDCAQLLPTPLNVENNSSEDIVTSDDVNTDSDEKQNAKKQLFFGLLAVIFANLFGFYGVFSAFDAHSIEVETFSTLKNILSITLVVSCGLIIFHGFRKGLIKKSDFF